MALRKYVGQRLIDLLTLNKEQQQEKYPDISWESWRSKRKLYKRKIREGQIENPLQESKAESDAVGRLQARNRELLGQLADAKEKTLEYASVLRTAVIDASKDVYIQPLKSRRLDVTTSTQEEIAVVDVSDLQLGKETPTYNIDVCKARMELLAKKIIEISTIQNQHHPVKTLHIQLLGDIVEGEGIFPGQAHQIHAGLYRQILEAQTILVQFISDLLGYFENIHVTAVIGNHGALKMKGEVEPETNMDRLVYSITRNTFKNEPRVTWNIPEGKGQRNWYAVNRIYGWGFLLAHGDQIRGWGGIPFYGALKKALGWIDAIDEPWDYLHIAHHHTPTMLTYNKRIVLFNGTTESTNEFAQELLAAVGHPTQWFGFVHPKHGVTNQYWINLEERIPAIVRYKEIGDGYRG